MRNFKRALSLALASIMLLGLMVVGAGAAGYEDFADKDEIVNKEAVETMVALNVINGKDDGSFDPSATVTRAEMAKMITIILNGGKEPTLGTSPAPSYSDIKGNWAEPYIEYCTNVGIISGKGDGTFHPNDPVTGTEAAKMILTAMNYNATVFHLTGANWAVTTNVLANDAKANLYHNINVEPNSGISRDNVAQMLYNGIQAGTMARDWELAQGTGEVAETYKYSATDSLLSLKYNGSIRTGIINRTSYNIDKEEYTYAVTAADGLGTIPGNLKTSADYSILFGQKVRIMYAPIANTANYKVYGIYPNESTVVAEGYAGDISVPKYNGVSGFNGNETSIKVSGTEYELDGRTGNTSVFAFNVNASVGYLSAVASNDINYSFKLIDNDADGKIDVMVKTPFTIEKVTYVGKDSITLSGGAEDTKDMVVYDGIAKDDIVMKIDDTNTANGGKIALVKMEVSEGNVSGQRTGEWKVEDTWVTNETGPKAPTYSPTINDTIEYVALGSRLYYAKIIESSTIAKDVAMVITADSVGGTDNLTTSDVKAKLLLQDGTTKTVVIAKMNGDTATIGNDSFVLGTSHDVDDRSGMIVTYVVNNDSEYELKDIYYNTASDKNIAGLDGKGSNTKYQNEQVGGYDLADDAKVFVFYTGTVGTASNTNKAKLYTGREIKNAYGNNPYGVDANSTSIYKKVNGFNYATIACIAGTNLGEPSITKGSNYGYLTAGAYESYSDGKTYRNYTIWTGSDTIEVQEESNKGLTNLGKGAVITYDTVSDGVEKNVNPLLIPTSYVTGWDGVSKIEIAGMGSSKITSDTVLLFVDSKNAKGVEGDIDNIQIAVEPNGTGRGYRNNVRYYKTGATYVNLLVVDVNQNMTSGPLMYLPGTATTTEIATALSSGDVTFGGNFTADASITEIPADSTLTVTGNMAAGTALNVKGTLVIEGNADLTNVTIPDGGKVVLDSDKSNTAIPASIAGTLEFTGATAVTVNPTIDATGALIVEGAFTPASAQIINGALTVGGAYTIGTAPTTAATTVITADSTTISAATTFNGSASLGAVTNTAALKVGAKAVVTVDSLTVAIGATDVDATGKLIVTASASATLFESMTQGTVELKAGATGAADGKWYLTAGDGSNAGTKATPTVPAGVYSYTANNVYTDGSGAQGSAMLKQA